MVVRGHQVFFAGLSRQQEEGVLVDVASPGLIDELVGEDRCPAGKGLRHLPPEVGPIVKEPVDVIKDILKAPLTLLSEVAQRPGSWWLLKRPRERVLDIDHLVGHPLWNDVVAAFFHRLPEHVLVHIQKPVHAVRCQLIDDAHHPLQELLVKAPLVWSSGGPEHRQAESVETHRRQLLHDGGVEQGLGKVVIAASLATSALGLIDIVQAVEQTDAS
mmetsp:Transcript_28455/g.75122  ORF Transcript_28455/g.75122 Transcript_28455/m.75122 type:complete len:216 (+) Transcript_28455:839-1486(+)